MMRTNNPSCRATRGAAVALVCALFFGACAKEQPKAPTAQQQAVTVLTIAARDVPVSAEYIAQTQSSQAVNIQARVSGFLDKRLYTEGAIVKAGTVLFQMDKKPFQAQVDAAQAQVQRNQAALQVAKANLDRTKPLTEQNALSQKDLDDAQGQYQQAAAALEGAKAQLESANLNLSYTTITSPVTGITSYAVVPDGTYVNSTNSQLTTVSVLSPMWVNFSISENEMSRIRDQAKKGLLKLPDQGGFVVDVELVDGTTFDNSGRITFTDPSYNPQTGTFLIRASVDNPKGQLRPNQYVRARIKGATRPNAILVPQRAVQQGGKGHFVWVVGDGDKVEQRPVDVGDWYGDEWFIDEGLRSGERIVVDGALRLSQGAQVKVTPYVPKTPTPTTPAPLAGHPPKIDAAAPAGTTAVRGEIGKAGNAPAASTK